MDQGNIRPLEEGTETALAGRNEGLHLDSATALAAQVPNHHVRTESAGR